MIRRGFFLLFLLVFSSFPLTAFTGGAIKVDILGFPLHWENSLTYNLDKGALKDGVFNHGQSALIIQEAFSTWTETLGGGGGLAVSAGGEIPADDVDVDENNFSDFFTGGTEECYDSDASTVCISPIVFDEDGEILDSIFGKCSKFSILGFAGFDDIDDGSGNPANRIVRRGQALFSGACLPDANGNTESKAGCGSCKRPLTEEEIRTIITHEVGHMMGMDHSQVNPDSFSLCTGPTGCPPGVVDDLPTMFPILVNGANMLDLHRDDESYFQRMYGNLDATTCSVKGTVFANDGSTEVRGVEVVAKNTDPLQNNLDAISFVSGAESPKVNTTGRTQGNCKERCGEYFITGLRDGETYQLCAQKILSQFTGGSSIEPVDPPFQAFSNDCPEGLTVSCACSGGGCPQFSGKDIVTDANPASIAQQEEPSLINDGSLDTSTGGCQLAKPRTNAYQWIQKHL